LIVLGHIIIQLDLIHLNYPQHPKTEIIIIDTTGDTTAASGLSPRSPRSAPEPWPVAAQATQDVGYCSGPLRPSSPPSDGGEQALQGESTCLNHHHQPQLLHPSDLVPFQPPKRQFLVRRLTRLPRPWIAYAFMAKWQIRKAIMVFSAVLASPQFPEKCKAQKKIKKR
jgi:hypothetical protein